MKRFSLIVLLTTLVFPLAMFARSNHAGWHGAAPVKRTKHGKPKNLASTAGASATYGI
jgi:hypothetical protein